MCAEVKTTWILPFKELFLHRYPSCRNHNCLHWEGRAGSGFGGGTLTVVHSRTCTPPPPSWCFFTVYVKEKVQQVSRIDRDRAVDQRWRLPVCVFIFLHGNRVCVCSCRNVVTSDRLVFLLQREKTEKFGAIKTNAHLFPTSLFTTLVRLPS